VALATVPFHGGLCHHAARGATLGRKGGSVSGDGVRQRTVTMTTSGALVGTVVLTGVGLWARSRNAPMWPTILTDWSLGSALLALSAAGVGAAVARRLPANPVAWLFVAIGVLSGLVFASRETTVLAMNAGVGTSRWTAWVFACAVPINMTCLTLVALIFPHGDPPSRRWRYVTVGVIAAGAAAALLSAVSPYSAEQTPFGGVAHPLPVLTGPVVTAALDSAYAGVLVGMFAAAAGVVVKLRRARGLERQQLKWFVFAAVVAVMTFFAGFYNEPLHVVATLVALPGLPIAAGLAVLRYRLYDIDRIISRTVTYAVVTVVVAVIYLAGVTTLTALLAPVTGDSPVAVAAATLLAAAAFGPARRRIQAGVDRRFDRGRYDAEQIAAAYRARLRDELDLTALRADLLTTVGATVQPDRASLWLRPAAGAR